MIAIDQSIPVIEEPLAKQGLLQQQVSPYNMFNRLLKRWSITKSAVVRREQQVYAVSKIIGTFRCLHLISNQQLRV